MSETVIERAKQKIEEGKDVDFINIAMMKDPQFARVAEKAGKVVDDDSNS